MEAQNLFQIIQKKAKWRGAEYFGLIFFFGFFSFRFATTFDFISLIFLLAVFLFLGSFLASKREKRRLLNRHDKYRIIADSVESLAMALLIAIVSIVALQSGINPILFEAYFCFSFIGYLLGSFSSETFFRIKNLSHFSIEERINYSQNLNKSIILPFNFKK